MPPKGVIDITFHVLPLKFIHEYFFPVGLLFDKVSILVWFVLGYTSMNKKCKVMPKMIP